ncbi:MAG: MaoC family dehydratase [Alphaproteobacteria bacterium]
MKLGQTAVYSKTVTDADILAFAGVSGDTNPIHLSDDFARTTMFEGRIAHGMLSASFISTLIGTRLPGPGAIYMSQNLKFLAPVRPGQTVNTRATVTDINHEKARITLHTQCMVGDEVVIEGEALIKVPVRNPPAK